MQTLFNQKITGIAASGHGVIAFDNSTPAHVLGAFPGDVVNIRVYKELPTVRYGEILAFHEYSDLREKNPDAAPFFSANTPWESLSSQGEASLKQHIIENIYPEYAKTLKAIETSSDIPNTHYRNKVAYTFESDLQGRLVFALYDRGTSQSGKKKQEENILVHPVLEKTAKSFLYFLNQHQVSQEDIKYVILRYSYFTDSVVAHVLFPETNRKKLPIRKADFEKFLLSNSTLQGILVSHSEPGTRSALTTKDFYQLGDINITEQVLDKKYQYHPSLFFQIYPRVFEDILSDIRLVLEAIPSSSSLPLLDLFSGIGIIGIELSDLVQSATGVELSSLSRDYALKNAEINNIQNFNFIEGSADDVLGHIKSDQILLVDPTRSGLSKELCEKINQAKPEYLVYVSCNPETQARDIRYIKNNYELIFAKSYNLFPKTHHLESLLILKRK